MEIQVVLTSWPVVIRLHGYNCWHFTTEQSSCSECTLGVRPGTEPVLKCWWKRCRYINHKSPLSPSHLQKAILLASLYALPLEGDHRYQLMLRYYKSWTMGCHGMPTLVPSHGLCLAVTTGHPALMQYKPWQPCSMSRDLKAHPQPLQH